MNDIFKMMSQNFNQEQIVHAITQPHILSAPSSGTKSIDTPTQAHNNGHHAVFSSGATPPIIKSQVEQMIAQAATPTPANIAMRAPGA